MEREIYNENGDSVDALKLFVKSDAMPQLLAGDDTLRILLNQINSLMKKATIQEQQKSVTIDKLVKLKTNLKNHWIFYKSEIEKLEQKKGLFD